MKNLKHQIEDWKRIHSLIADSRKMFITEGREFLRNEVYPLIREYVVKYNTKYDYDNIPRDT